MHVRKWRELSNFNDIIKNMKSFGMSHEKNEVLYSALKSKDPRFDGHFFVGVASTGIYCRPICKARLPKIENCTFFISAAEAEKAGYRPCLLCRPELTPGLAPIFSTENLARRTAKIIEDNCKFDSSFSKLAEQLGCTDRHLRRVFVKEYHVSPVQYLQTCRLLLAKSLLTDTKLSIMDIAMTSGFGSLRRFNDLFKKQYKLPPSGFRKQLDGRSNKDFDSITLLLGYRPPYNWKQMLDFLKQRAIPKVELIKDDEYYRTVHITLSNDKEYFGWIKVENMEEKNAVALTISHTLFPQLPRVLNRVKHLFDLFCEPRVIYEKLSSMNEIIPEIIVLGTRVPGCFDAFEMSVRAILGQQITVKAATTLAGRFAKNFGTPIETGIDQLEYAFPSPCEIVELKEPIEDHLGPIGVIAKRAKTIMAMAKVFANNTIEIESCVNPEDSIKQLMELPGIGMWTAQYIAMRAMGWMDAFPDTDLGVKKVLAPRTQKEILALAESWRPWRAYATINLWNYHNGG